MSTSMIPHGVCCINRSLCGSRLRLLPFAAHFAQEDVDGDVTDRLAQVA
jgi:hypothetical protein